MGVGGGGGGGGGGGDGEMRQTHQADRSVCHF